MSWRERRRNSLFLSPAPRSPDPDDLPWHCQADRRRGALFIARLGGLPRAVDWRACISFGVMSAVCRRITPRVITAWFRKRCCRESAFHRRIFTAWRAKRSRRVAANEYEEELRRFFALAPGQVPRFDSILLGLGEDGHTASLFPGGEALNQNERLVATAYVERLRAHRLTLTLPVINAAAQVTFLIAGQSKRAIVNEIVRSDADSFKYPAARVSPSDGQLTWLITADAMGNLPIR